MLANGLKCVKHSVTSSFQGAFVWGRQIQDGMLIANECIDSIIEEGSFVVRCKLDIEKDCNSVSWNFLDYMMLRMGFVLKWRNWMKKCYGTATYSVLINRSPVRYFDSLRGLRQGDPISPFLFLMVVGDFGVLFQRVFSR